MKRDEFDSLRKKQGEKVKLTVKYRSHNSNVERSSLILPVSVVEAAQEERDDSDQF